MGRLHAVGVLESVFPQGVTLSYLTEESSSALNFPVDEGFLCG